LHVSCWQFNCQSAETAPDFRQPNDWRKRWDLVSRRNVSIARRRPWSVVANCSVYT